MTGPLHYNVHLDIYESRPEPIPYLSYDPPEDVEPVDWDEVEGMAADRAYDKWKDEGCHEDG